jgi:non-ribosomal peptide synthetase component F
VEVRVAKLDLTLALWERPEGLSGWINYSTDLFDEARIARLVRLWTTLAGAVAEWPTARVSDLGAVLVELERREREAEKGSLKTVSFKRPRPAADPSRGNS